jgi:predicted RNA-binding protein with PIN domain
MPYLIDGNNVMDQAGVQDADLSAARKRLIIGLVHFVAETRGKVKVVFDGTADDEFPDGRVYKGVRILYARPGSDADTRIKDIIRRASYRRDMILVTSDRELESYAKRQGVRAIKAGKFRAMITESESKLLEKEKSGPVEQINVEEWLEFFKSEK